MPKVWLITGSASGLGRHIAEAVLGAGNHLVATARDPRALQALVEKYGDQVRTAPLTSQMKRAPVRPCASRLMPLGVSTSS